MAIGSRRTWPIWSEMTAAVTSEPAAEPKKTPCVQLLASLTRGMVEGLRPPNNMASMGTPVGLPL